jgi:hypothetical protein
VAQDGAMGVMPVTAGGPGRADHGRMHFFLAHICSLALIGCLLSACGGGDESQSQGSTGELRMVAGRLLGETAHAGTVVGLGERFAMSNQAFFNRLGGVAALTDGSAIVQADLYLPIDRTPSQAVRVVRVTGGGEVSIIPGFGGSVACGFLCIRDTNVRVAAHPAGKAYVYDEKTAEVAVIGPTGFEQRFALVEVREASPLAVDANGALYFFTAMGLMRRNPDGRRDLVSADAALGSNALVVDGSGTLYVAGRTAIHKVSAQGAVTLHAGDPAMGGAVDANGSAARFGLVQALAADPGGTLYVADAALSAAVRKVTPSGAVSTVVGRLGQIGHRLGQLPGGLALPVGVSLTLDGGLWIADNQALLHATAR